MDVNERLIVEFYSKYKAAHALQISNTTFRRYSNTLTFIYSPLLEMYIKIVEINDPRNKKEVQFNSIQKYPVIAGLDLNNIEKGKLFSFCSFSFLYQGSRPAPLTSWTLWRNAGAKEKKKKTKDATRIKKTIFGIYSSPGEAASILDNKKDSRYISRYINLERTVKVGPAITELYFVLNPEYLQNTSLRKAPKSPNNMRAIILVDILKNTAIKYSSVKELLEVLNIKSTGSTSIVKRYMNPTRIYKSRYFFHYAENLSPPYR